MKGRKKTEIKFQLVGMMNDQQKKKISIKQLQKEQATKVMSKFVIKQNDFKNQSINSDSFSTLNENQGRGQGKKNSFNMDENFTGVPRYQPSDNDVSKNRDYDEKVRQTGNNESVF